MRISSKRLAALAGVGVLLAGAAACGGGASSASSDTVTLRFAHVLPEGEPASKAVVEAAAQVAKLTDGRVKLETFPAGQLGSDVEIMEAILDGSVDLTAGSPPFDRMPALSVTLAPFLFDSSEGMSKALRSDVAQKVLWDKEEAKVGVVNLDTWFSGFNDFTSSKKFTNPDSIKGLKIRVPESEASIDMINAIGATATPIAFPELYTALQTKVVDGQYNPLPRIFASNFQEVQEYFTPVHISANILAVTIGKKSLDKLSAGDQKILRDVFQKAGDDVRVENEKLAAEQLAEVKAGEMQLVEPDIAAFQAAVKEKFLPKYEGVYGKGVYQQLQDAAK